MTAFAWPGDPDSEPITPEDARELATLLAGVADSSRVRILSLIAHRDPAPVTVSALVTELELSQSTVSHHLKLLLAAGFLEVERNGNWSMYRTRPETLARVARILAPR